MLVESMTRKEITKEVLNDFDKFFHNSTGKRLCEKYEQERIKRHIKKEAEYERCYEIKTNSKNRWVFVLYKEPLSKKYQGLKDCATIIFAYYYTKKGICVFRVADHKTIEVYYGHLFARYRERMGLDLPNLLDVAVHYLKISSFCIYKYLPEQDGKFKILGVVKDGFQLGEKDMVNQWYLLKTFIPKTTANIFSATSRIKEINDMKMSIINQDSDEDEAYYQDLAILLEILEKEEKDEKKKEVGRLMPVQELQMKDIHQPGLDFVDFIKNQTKTGV